MPEMKLALNWLVISGGRSPGLKIILFTGAIHVPQNELKYIDLVIHKLQGVDTLLAAMESLLTPGGEPTTTCPAGQV